MTGMDIYTATGIILIGIGIFPVLINTHALKQILGMNIMGIGIFMIFLSSANAEQTIDSLPHALVLTGIVVAAAGTALYLFLLVNINTHNKQHEKALEENNLDEKA